MSSPAYHSTEAAATNGMSPITGMPAAASGYFIDQKKGEVNELKALLKNMTIEKDIKRKREVIKKVIAYMTLGIDVSRLFTDMIMAIETKDIVIKKMVYLYLCNYAHKEPEMAIMCINSLRRECDNDDPMVRGLALRSLCSLRIESILEYIINPLQRSLTDVSAYVRKTGVMGILKLNKIAPQMVESHGYISKLYGMMQDPDAYVVTNVILVLNELLLDKGSIEINQSIIMHLLNRIGEFSEWGLSSLLDLVARYKPSSEDETFAIMNLLDPVLRTASSSAVLNTFNCFMKLSSNFSDLEQHILTRSKPPMLTLITGSQPEVQFVMLKHLQCILARPAALGIFDDEYRQFFVRYNEPPHVKHLKVEILPLLANLSNVKEITSELSEYVTDVDSEVSKRAIGAIASIALRVPSVAVDMTITLVELVDLDMPYVRNEAVKNLTNVIRVFPEVSVHIFPVLAKCIRRLDDSDSKAAIVWIIGEYGSHIVEAPYMLEPIIDNYDEEVSVQMKLQILSAAMKIFFKRPPEMKAMLGRLLASAVNDTSDQDVHDRALMYYRLLSTDVKVAESVFNKPANSAPIKVFAEHFNMSHRQVFDEFNTLAVIYNTPSNRFIHNDYQLKLQNAPMVDDTFNMGGSLNNYSGSSSSSLSDSNNSSNGNNNNATDNLLDFDMTTHTQPSSGGSSSGVALATPISHLHLKSSLNVMTPQQFQQMWGAGSDCFNGHLFTLNRLPGRLEEVAASFSRAHITTIASGPISSGGSTIGMKFILHAAEVEDLLGNEGISFMIQLSLLPSLDVTAVIKVSTGSCSESIVKQLADIIKNTIVAIC